MIRRDEALAVLSSMKGELEQRYGITALGLFGSVAREEQKGESDVDVVVKMREPNLYTLVHVRETLEDALHENVDIVHYQEQMNGFLKNRIDREAIYV
jgi:predicted nucleotidyltransferase